MDGSLLDYLRPGAYPPNDFSYVWVYLILLVFITALASGLFRLLGKRWTFNQARVSQHMENMRAIRAKQQEETERLAAARTEEPQVKERQNPVQERRPFVAEDRGSDNKPWRPNVRDRYKGRVGKSGG